MGFSEIFCCFVPRNLYDDPNSCEKKKLKSTNSLRFIGFIDLATLV
jgi:hypothetical protein